MTDELEGPLGACGGVTSGTEGYRSRGRLLTVQIATVEAIIRRPMDGDGQTRRRRFRNAARGLVGGRLVMARDSSRLPANALESTTRVRRLVLGGERWPGAVRPHGAGS